MTAPVFLRQQAARASRQDPHDSTIDTALELTPVDVLWITHISGWPRVEKVLQAIEIVEALGIDPAGAAPDYGRMFTTACPPVIGRNLTHRHDITPGCGASG
jgi:hypothetical protein